MLLLRKLGAESTRRLKLISILGFQNDLIINSSINDILIKNNNGILLNSFKKFMKIIQY